MNRTLSSIGDKMTIEICQLYNELGLNCIWNDGKDLTLIDKEKDLPSGNLERSQQKNFLTDSIANNSSANKSNYSVICRRCGRKLTSEVSRDRGYGSHCYRQTKLEHLKENTEQAKELDGIDGQMNLLDEIKKCS